MNNSGSNVFWLLLVRPLSMSSNAFVNGARMNGVCAFIAGYFEHEHENVVNTSASNTDFSHLPMRYRVHNN